MTLIAIYALVSVVVVSLISLIGVATLSMDKHRLARLVFVLVALSVGALFGDVFIHLVPELFEGGHGAANLSFLILGGILLFFALEKLLRWRHMHEVHTCEGPDCEEEIASPLSRMILVSDGAHNLIDGLIIGASYLVSIPVGIASTIAILLHEIPQEIGDFGVLIHSGLSRARALVYNMLSALAAVVGTVIALVLGTRIESATDIIVAVAIGGFLYIAGSDLVPELQKTTAVKRSLVQFSALLFGVLLMVLLIFLE